MAGGSSSYTPHRYSSSGRSYNRRRSRASSGCGCLGCMIPTVLCVITIVAGIICMIAIIT